MNESRKIVQVININNGMSLVLCNDGTIWALLPKYNKETKSYYSEWVQKHMPPIPQPEEGK